MKIPWTAAVAAFAWLATAVGCSSTPPPATSFHRWGWENTDHAKASVDRFKHVLLVCIYEDELRDEGPHRSLYRARGTVVRTYKGDWRTSEGILFIHGIDSPASPDFRSNIGKLMFLFTDHHTDAEIGFEAGTFYHYDPELQRVIEFLFPRESR
ncbi:MAG: hypothetical protein KJ072_07335 [Verrucomicrobia bacterium]|nr:hypothetical protein [Verrucomicrobiota bacterium]